MRDQAFPFIFTGAALAVVALASFIGVDGLLRLLLAVVVLAASAFFVLGVLLIRERLRKGAEPSKKVGSASTKAAAPAKAAPAKAALAKAAEKPERRKGVGSASRNAGVPAEIVFPEVGKKVEDGKREGVIGSLWWRREGDLLRIGGQGEMRDHPFRGDCWNEVTDVVIEEGVRSIGKRAFEDWECLSRVVLPKNLNKIGNSAFAGSGLVEIVLPEGMTQVEGALFRGCRKLRSVALPDSAKEIRFNVFEGCESLSCITLPRGLDTIGYRAFRRSGIRELKLPEGLVSIGGLAFDEMPLKELTIPDSVTEIKAPLFSKRPSFPVRLPKGREDMPVFPAQTDEDHLQDLAFRLFEGRSDVLLESSGDPARDRYMAVQQLWAFTIQCTRTKPQLSDSRAHFGELFFRCGTRWVEVPCYDGGCCDTDIEARAQGVEFSVLAEDKFLRCCAEFELVQKEPFRIWQDSVGRRILLEQPFGLADCFMMTSDYPIRSDGFPGKSYDCKQPEGSGRTQG